jgi:hypothetical protein
VRSWLVFFALFPVVASAETNRAFAQWRDKAKPIQGVSQFLSDFIGSCDSDPIEGEDCRKKVTQFRQQATGSAFYAILPDEAQRLIQLGRFNNQTQEFEFLLTPFFEGAGFGLTQGTPTRLDDEGRPVIPLMHIVAKLPDGVTYPDVERLFRTGGVKMQIVFKPTGMWQLPRKDKKGAYVQGVKSNLVAIRLSSNLNGDEIATLISK